MLDTTKYLFLGTHQNEPKQLPNLLVIVYQLNVLNNNFTFMDYPLLMHGEFTFVHHNEIRDIKAEWLDCVCHDVVVKPPLQPLTGENVIPATANRQDDARADIHACGCWGHVFDIRVFVPIHEATATPVSLLCIDAMR